MMPMQRLICPVRSHVCEVWSGFPDTPRTIQVHMASPRGWEAGSTTFFFHYAPGSAEPSPFVKRPSLRHGTEHYARRVPAEVRARAAELHARFAAKTST